MVSLLRQLGGQYLVIVAGPRAPARTPSPSRSAPVEPTANGSQTVVIVSVLVTTWDWLQNETNILQILVTSRILDGGLKPMDMVETPPGASLQ